MRQKVRSCFTIVSVLLCGIVLGLTTFVRAEDQPGDVLAGKKVVMANYAKVFTGPDNLKLTVAPYTQNGVKRALILIEGVEGAWDGKVLDHALTPDTRSSKAYVTQNDGKDWKTLTMNQYQGDGNGDTWEFYLPGHPGAIVLNPDDKLSKEASTRSLLRRYNSQQGR